MIAGDSGLDGLNDVAFMMPNLESVMRSSGLMIGHGHPIVVRTVPSNPPAKSG